MNNLIQDYQAYVIDLQSRINQQKTYFSQFAPENDLTIDIDLQEKQIMNLIKSLKDRAESNKRIKAIHEDLIVDHQGFQKMKINELQEPFSNTKWKKYLQINHEVSIRIQILNLLHIVNPNNQTSLNFQALRFYLYHANQVAKSPQVRYNPSNKLHLQSELVDGKIYKSNKKIEIQITNQIRDHNIYLYNQLFAKMPLKITAESSYGLIVGVANINIDDLLRDSDDIQNRFRCVTFRNYAYNDEGEEFFAISNAFQANITISIESSPIPPEVGDLRLNAENQIKTRQARKSKSPNRIVSVSPSRASPKKKRILLNKITQNNPDIIYLTAFEGLQYRYKIQRMGSKREITYRQMKNIKQRKLELVWVEDNYYLKCLLVRETSGETAHADFLLNEQQFVVHVISDTLLKIIDLEDYIRLKQKKEKINNKIININNNLIYVQDRNKLIKNYIKQTLVDGLQSNTFIKTPFSDCDIFMSPPFNVTSILHKEQGYMVYFYYEESQSLKQEIKSNIIFYLQNKSKNMNQIHVFDCTIAPRSPREAIYKQIKLNRHQQFYNIVLDLVVSESHVYQIRSCSSSIWIVNGCNYRYSLLNNYITIQILNKPTSTVEIIFTDNKTKSFAMYLSLSQQEDS